jgi:hypothetical protein
MTIAAAASLRDWRAEQAAARAASLWRPMDEAKQTARPILLLCSGGPVVGVYSDIHGSWIEATYGTRIAQNLYPSRWMPIPDWRDLP